MRVVRPGMGMPITVEVVASEPEARLGIEAVFAYFARVDAVFSTYRPDSEISRINRGELPEDEASLEVREVLVACREFQMATDGYFDMRRPNGIDPSGLVKGWAIWQAAQLLDARGYADYVISAGGDVQVSGRNGSGELWRVGIQHPVRPVSVAKTLRLDNAAVATSGTYERGHHIYNPHTARPVTELVSLSVVAPTIYEADVYATAAFARGRPGLDWLQRQGFDGYMITSDLEAYATPGFAAYEL